MSLGGGEGNKAGPCWRTADLDCAFPGGDTVPGWGWAKRWPLRSENRGYCSGRWPSKGHSSWTEISRVLQLRAGEGQLRTEPVHKGFLGGADKMQSCETLVYTEGEQVSPGDYRTGNRNGEAAGVVGRVM